jgi:hypothetical protein
MDHLLGNYVIIASILELPIAANGMQAIRMMLDHLNCSKTQPFLACL